MVETVNTLRREAFSKLNAVRNIKKNQIEGYFSERFGDIQVLSGNRHVVQALEAINRAFVTEGGSGQTGWTQAVAEFGPWLEQYGKEYGYYDLFLISRNGDVVYTVAKEKDLGENLIKGSLATSGLGRMFNKALTTSVLVFILHSRLLREI
ncbi:MAG: hypothetical protein HQL75_09750 [Magnetococcales bacterium]|nr:hypothetical protein [Magnetococcales bacterium]